jgi:hypothetical protein
MLSVKKNISNIFKILFIIGLDISLADAENYIRIYSLRKDVSFLMIKQTEVIERPEYLIFFLYSCLHKYFCFAEWIFSDSQKRFRLKKFHKNAGKIYIFLILLSRLLQEFIWEFLPTEEFILKFHLSF